MKVSFPQKIGVVLARVGERDSGTCTGSVVVVYGTCNTLLGRGDLDGSFVLVPTMASNNTLFLANHTGSSVHPCELCIKLGSFRVTYS